MKHASLAGRKMLWRMAAIIATMSSVTACSIISPPRPSSTPAVLSYEVIIEERKPSEARFRMKLPFGTERVHMARKGDMSAISHVRCADDRAAELKGLGWSVPHGCGELRWLVALKSVDALGIDAAAPVPSFSRNHSYWLLPEQAAFLRATNDSATGHIKLRLDGGRTIRKDLTLPSVNQPPLYAVIGGAPGREYSLDGLKLRIFGNPPQYSWMNLIHNKVLAQWLTWRGDLMTGSSPDTIDWIWVRTPSDAEPGYSASAGSGAIISQIKLRDGDPDAETKARVVIGTSAAHEGFHTITGAAGQAWPAWVNESLASHFAIKAARAFLAPEDQKWLNAIYLAQEVQAPLLEAQKKYSAGNVDKAQIFYSYGARFWRVIENMLTNEPNRSGRLAALIIESQNFSDIDLNGPDELANFLDTHSDGKAGPVALCFLLNKGCVAGALSR